jgi:hypothetical protein
LNPHERLETGGEDTGVAVGVQLAVSRTDDNRGRGRGTGDIGRLVRNGDGVSPNRSLERAGCESMGRDEPAISGERWPVLSSVVIGQQEVSSARRASIRNHAIAGFRDPVSDASWSGGDDDRRGKAAPNVILHGRLGIESRRRDDDLTARGINTIRVLAVDLVEAARSEHPGAPMSESTPDDLATFFRSVPRRLREAIGDAEPSSVAGLVSELEAHIEAAQRLIGAPADPAAIASAISARPADAWNETTLDTVRREALAAGRVLRRIAEVTGSDVDDD